MAFWRRLSRQMQAATEQVAVAPSSSPVRTAKPRPGMMRQYDLVERVRSYNPDTNEDLPYTVYVSSKVSKDKPAPLIVALHGMGGDSNFFVRGKLVDLAEEGGAGGRVGGAGGKI